MQIEQTFMHTKAKGVSEARILLYSFVTAFAAGIIIITALFVTVKKFGSKLTAPADITYSVRK